MINETIEYLEGIKSRLGVRAVDHAWTMDPVDNFAVDIPAVLLFSGKHTGIGDADYCQRQTVVIQLNAFVVCTTEELDAVLAALRPALLTLQPDDVLESYSFSEGAPRDIRGELVWWLDQYHTTARIASA